MDWTHLAGWLVSGGIAIWHVAYRHRRQLFHVAAECCLFAEKAASGATGEELENTAIAYAREWFPGVREEWLRWAIRDVCALRRRRGARVSHG